MKRTALLSLLLALSLTACGTSAAAPATAAPAETVTEAAAATPPETSPTGAASAQTSPDTAVSAPDSPVIALPDGVYSAKFNTDSSMFHVNESQNGRGVLTVQDGQMMIHVSLASKSILKLYPGLASDAENDEAGQLLPTADTVTYADGFSETVNGFDIPVPALNTEFDLALIGKKGKWYDHKVSISDPQPVTEALPALADGSYTADVSLSGGTGKTTVLSPCTLTVKDGIVTARIVFSSSSYDYVKVNGQQYLCLTTDGGSTFEIPVTAPTVPLLADTTAMSQPHEIEYILTLDVSSITAL